ncbi:MAG: stage 0 sporulation family protein [Clostridiales bacterium]|nr:stage 0 sporulation family protein [Clostridiales bacterium]
MQEVVGVRFKKAGKIYYFDPDNIELDKGIGAIVETSRGIEYGEIVVGPKKVANEDIISPLKKVIRKATQEDGRTVDRNKEKEAEAFKTCMQRIEKHGLPMKLVDVEYTFDGSKVIFYFTADGRVDFRELVKELAAVFRTRIELRQIGVRDEAKLMGGLGPCGRALCCVSFLGEFEPVSIKMAKEQNLSLNPAKISGICGRLMCCLKYEQDYYERVRKFMPRINSEVVTPEGKGEVISCNALTGKIRAKITNSDGTPDIVEFHLKDIKYSKYQDAISEDEIEEIDGEVASLLDD